MTQVIHILRKDLRRLRWLLLLWVAILAGQVALAAVGAATAGLTFAASMFLRELSGILPPLQTLMLALLVARLVHDEPLVGWNAFWLTRPYSSGALLAAKLLFVVVVLVLAPLAADLSAMSVFHAGPRAQVYATPAFLSGHLVWALGLCVFAVVTPSFSAFVLTILGTVVGFMATLLLLITAAFALGLGQTSPVYNEGLMVPDPTPGVISLVVFMTAALTVIVYQYRHRRWRIAVVLAAAGVAASGIVPTYWPWPFLRQATPQPGQWARSTNSTQPKIDPRFALNIARDPFETLKAPTWRVHAFVELMGMPADFATQGVRVSGTLTLPDGTTLRSRQMASFRRDGTTEGIVRAAAGTPVHAVLGADLLNDAERPAENWPALLSLTEGEYARHKGKTGRFEGTLEFRVYQTRIRAALPLRKGVAVDDDVTRIELVRATPIAGGYRLVVRHWRALSLTATDYGPNVEFFLRNRRERAAVTLGRESSWSGSFAGMSHGSQVLSAALGNFSLGPTPSGFAVQTEKLEFPWRIQGGYVALSRLEPEWFDDAELVLLETRYAGTVTRYVSLADFRIPEE